MKKMITAGCVVLLALLFLVLSQFQVVGAAEYDGYVVSNLSIEDQLQAEDADKVLELTDIKETEPIYSRLGSYYFGEHKVSLNMSYPLFSNANQSITFLNSDGLLYDTDFNEYETKEQMTLTKGELYHATRLRADLENYLFYGLNNGLFMNALQMQIDTTNQHVKLAPNSILYLQEDMIRCYVPENQYLVLTTMSGLDDGTMVQIGDQSMPYKSLLLHLGLLNTDTPTDQEEDTQTPDQKEAKKNTSDDKKQINTSTNTNDANKKTEVGKDQGKEDSKDTNDKTEDNKKPDNGKDDDNKKPDNGKDDDNKKPDNGKDKPTKPGDDNDDDDDKPTEDKYITPTVAHADYTSTVYSISSNIKINDPQKHLIKKRVEVQVWTEGKLYMRKYIKKTSDFTINNLKPDTEYLIYTKYSYTNEKEVIVEKTLSNKTITTKKTDSLEPISFAFDNGEVLSQQIKLDNIKITSDKNSEAMSNVTKLVLEVGEESFALSSYITNLRQGMLFDYTSPARLTSNSELAYAISAYDYYGNRLIVKNNSGSTRTCKKAPTVTLKTVSNKVSYINLGLKLDNPDELAISNYHIVIKDPSGKVLKDEAITTDSIIYEDLDANKVLDVTIYGDFDIDNGKGFLSNQVMANAQIVTVPLTSLGKISTRTDIGKTTYDSVTFDFKIDTSQTDARLIQLLNSIAIEIDNEQGDKRTITLNDEQIQQVKARGTIPFTLEHLSSVSVYKVKVLMNVHHGTLDYAYVGRNNIDSFKTLKTPAMVQVKDVTITESSISLSARTYDPDGSVLDDYTGLRVYNSRMDIVDASVIHITKDQTSEEGWTQYQINNLNSTESYKFEYYAPAYNETDSKTTRKSNYILRDDVYYVPAGVRGSLSIGVIEYDKTVANRAYAEMIYTLIGQENNIYQNKYYFELEKNGKETSTVEYDLGDSNSASNDSHPVKLAVDREAEYKVTLYVYDANNPWKRLNLASASFDTFAVWDTIANEEEFYTKLQAHPEYNYYVIKDLDLGEITTQQNLKPTGIIDFQTHKLTAKIMANDTSIFHTIIGTLKNVQVILSFNELHEIDNAAGLTLINSGEIADVVLDFNGTASLGNENIAGLCLTNTGKIHDFVINANQSLHTSHQGSYGVMKNQGTIEQGYVQGAAIHAEYNNRVLAELDWITLVMTNKYSWYKAVGGICAYNDSQGSIKNVFSNTTMYRTTSRPGFEGMDEAHQAAGSTDEDSIGSVLGLNVGMIKNIYGTGEYRGANEKYDAVWGSHGPTVGTNDVASATNVDSYYVTDYKHTNDKLNKRVTKLMLYDLDFQNTVLSNNSFNTDYVKLGYFPQVHLPSNFPLQQMIPLPVVPESESVDVKSSKVIEKTDDTATIEIVLNNPGSGDPVSISILDIANVKIVSFKHEDKYTRLTVEIDHPSYYYTDYSVKRVEVKNNFSGGKNVIRTYGDGDKYVSVEFFRPIYNAQDWQTLVSAARTNREKENYKLMDDLDFKDIASSKYYMNYTYSGIIDGNGHKISNGYLQQVHFLNTLNGEIRNTTFDNFGGSTSYQRFITTINGSGIVDHCVFSNFNVIANTNQIALLVYNHYGTVSNVVEKHITMTQDNNGNIECGGMAANTYNGSIIKNSAIYDLQINVSSSSYNWGIGGMVTCLNDYAVIENCIVQGKIISDANTVGGVAARVGVNGIIRNVICDVDLELTNNTRSSMQVLGGEISSGNPKTFNVLSMGNLTYTQGGNKIYRQSSSASDNITDRNRVNNVYAAKAQLINGAVDEAFLGKSFSGMLSYEELKTTAAYTNKLQLSSAFDLTKVKDGILPKIKGTDGKVLPNQSDILLMNEDEAFKINSIKVLEPSSAGATLQINIQHPRGMKLEEIAFNDELNIIQMSVQSLNTTSSVATVVITPKRYYDNYKITKVVGSVNGKQQELAVSYMFDLQFFKNINSYEDWQQINPSTMENYYLTGSIDFTGHDYDMRRNFRVNRFIGVADADGNKPKLSNITVHITANDKSTSELNAENTPLATINVFQIVNSEFTNIDIANYKIVRDEMTKFYANASFIGQLYGNVTNVKVDTFEIAKDATTDNIDKVAFIARTSTHWGGQIKDVHISNATIKGSTQVAGLLAVGGYKDNLIYHCSIKDSTITGKNLVAGLNSYGDAWYSTVSNCVIKGITNVGGISRDYSSSNTIIDTIVCGAESVGGASVISANYTYLKNVQVYGVVKVGGVAGTSLDGASNTLIANLVEDSYIKACNYDAASNSYHEPNLEYLIALGRKQTGASYCGGIAGGGNTLVNNANVSTNAVINSTVIGVDYVGGIIGGSRQFTMGNVVHKTTVTGNNYVGGIAGAYSQVYSRYFKLNEVQADVTGNTNVGGIIGYMENKDLNSMQTNQTYVLQNIYSQYQKGLTGKKYVGGIIGASSNTQTQEDILYKGNVFMGSLYANELYSMGTGSSNTNDCYQDLMILEGSSVNGVPIDTAIITGSKLINKDQLTTAFYQSIGYNIATSGTYPTTVNDWNLTKVVTGDRKTLPVVKNAANSTYTGCDAPIAGVPSKILLQTYLALDEHLIDLPDLALSKSRKADVEMKLEPIISMNAVDTINFEFGYGVSGISYYLKDQPMKRNVVDGNLLTLTYDYQEPFSIVFMVGEASEEITVDPSEMTHRIMLYQQQYYYIDQAGKLHNGDQMIEGSYLNLFGGYVLDTQGNVFSIEDMLQVRSVTNAVKQETIAKAFMYQDQNIQTYQTYSLINNVMKPMRLFVKDEQLTALDPSLDIKEDSIVIDRVKDQLYQSVLGSDGVIYQLKDDMILPTDFKNHNIRYMADNLSATTHILFVEYEDGSIYAFDYETDEVLIDVKAEESMSFLAYCADFFDFSTPIVDDTITKVYQDVEGLKTKLEETSIEEALLQIKDAKSDASHPQEDGNDVNTPSEKTKEELAKNDHQQDSLVKEEAYFPYYNAKTQEYELYKVIDVFTSKDTADTLKSETEVMSENPDLVKFYAMPKTKLHIGNRLGFFTFVGAGISICLGVLYLFIRRRNYRS